MRIFEKVLRFFLLIASLLGMNAAATVGSYCTTSGFGDISRCGFPNKESAAQWGWNNSHLARLDDLPYSYGGVVYFKHAPDGAPPADGPTNYWWGYYYRGQGPYHYYPISYSTAPVAATAQPSKNAGLPSCPVNKNKPRQNTGMLIGGIGNPINPGTGNKYQEETDYTGSGVFPLMFDRMYNSLLEAPTNITALGAHWRHYYHRKVQITDASSITVLRHDGKDYDFTLQGSAWMPDADITDTLAPLTDVAGNLSGWQYTTADNAVETYDAAGKLILITQSTGLTQTLGYDMDGRLIGVTDSFGRSLTFTYDANNRINTLTDPAGGVYGYSYDLNSNLSSVTYPDGKVRTYLYNEPDYTQNTDLPYALTGIIDENDNRFSIYHYDTQGRAISTEHAGGTDKFTLIYNDGSTVVTDPLGTRTYNFQTILGVAKNTGVTQPCASCGSDSAARTYDSNGNLASSTDFKGNRTTYTYDLTRNLEISRTEAAGTPLARTITTAWHPTFRLPTQITEPTRVTTYTYDAQGNVTQKTLAAGTLSRTWNYTYNSLGQILSVDGPRTDVADISTYTYDAQGNLATVTNALGHITRLTAYDAHGRPLTLQDPNGLITQLRYDARGRLITRTVGTELTQFQYDGVGQLTRIILPDNSFMDYTYDAAHRLIAMTDALGNSIRYTLDALGNRIKEDILDPNNTLTQQRRRVFDNLNRLAQDIGAQNQITAYQYDANGNLTGTTDPLSHTSVSAYDALNRLVEATDPQGGLTQYAYDASDRITQVTDPRGIGTAYTYDGLDNLTQTVSLDAGATTHTYDAAGNLITQTDARNKKTVYTYDALNRLTQTVFADATAITYQYDTGANAIDRLSKVTDSSGVTQWAYDPQGRITRKTQRTGTVTHALDYTYDSSGRLTQLIYPSGKRINYSYDATGNISQISVDDQILLSGIQYQPYGSFKSAIWGNGTHYNRSFDQDGRLTTHPQASLTYDAAGRIVLQSQANGVLSYGYDPLDRLTHYADAQNLASTYQYDANGNRTQLIQGGITTAYHIPLTSNRLTSQSGPANKSYTYDAAGNLISDGAFTYTYNAQNRLTRAVSKKGKTDYTHNSLGQRVSKTHKGKITRYVYDESGHLIGEYKRNGRVKQETVYLDDTPVAVLQGKRIYYIYADHLDTPRVIVNRANKVIWRWDSDPFGNTSPRIEQEDDGDADENEEGEDGEGKFTYNLRFPGQYFDKETGLHYNYFRDYNPSLGRYIQSDPIGLAGGLNTYTYALANPISNVDPDGLQVCYAFYCIPVAVPSVRPPPVNPWWLLIYPRPVGAGSDVIPPGPGILESRSRGKSDPVTLPVVNPGRDCNGKCKPCPPGARWWVPRPGHGHQNGYWHEIRYNQNPRDCECRPDRPSGGLQGN